MPHAIQYRPLRAPHDPGQALIDPPLSAAAKLLVANQTLARHADAQLEIGGLALGELRAEARERLVNDALAYTRTYLDLPPFPALTPTTPIILSGHQPELFHPGVWFKNFVLSSVAARTGAIAINLIIDNDTLVSPALRVPRLGPRGEPFLENCPLDSATSSAVPYEERPIIDHDLFASFAARVDRPLARRLWRHLPARGAGREPLRFGATVALMRHRLEAEAGLRTLELPLSAVCDAPGFARFTLHVLAELARFHELYNDALREYRQVHRVRSQSHPVPQLVRDESWYEAPFWIWSSDAPLRRPLFARVAGDELLLTDRQQVRFALPLLQGQVTHATLAAWLAARLAGIKLRPRALLTTMYARLVLSDLFLHGIGGAKYDQLTDALIERCFGLTAPSFMTATATFMLQPLDPALTAARLRQIEQELRELPYHPETFMNASQRQETAIAGLLAEKRHWIELQLPTGERRERHQGIKAVNARLITHLPEVTARLPVERDVLAQQLERERLLGSREFSFCLFDENLPSDLLQLAQA